MAKVVRKKEKDCMKTKAEDLLQKYVEQDNKEENLAIVSPLRQKEALKIVSADAKDILGLRKKYNRPVPSEIKIIYTTKNGAAQCKYSYEEFTESFRERTEMWFNGLINEEENNA